MLKCVCKVENELDGIMQCSFSCQCKSIGFQEEAEWEVVNNHNRHMHLQNIPRFESELGAHLICSFSPMHLTQCG